MVATTVAATTVAASTSAAGAATAAICRAPAASTSTTTASIGEPADCNIGDGVTLDPDGDGVNEDIVYVDCGNGSDTAGNGSAQNPWRTIQFADSQLDGPGDGAEDIIAFRGICSLGNNFSPSVAGVPGARVKPPSGSEQWAFEFPTNPAMLIGWDFDNDGQYPPFDTDDIAVLDGNGASRAFLFNNPDDNSYYELAHFRAESYGSPDGRSGGFLKPSAFPSDRSHLYLHDLSVRDTNRGRGLDGRRNVINFFNIQNFHYMALINIEFLDTGGFFSRGGGREDGSPAAQYFRFQNISYTAHGCDNPGPCDNAPAGVAVSKIWGYIDHFEWIDSEWDANVREWSPQESGGPAGAGGIVPAQCSQDWIVRNNTFIDFKSIVTVQPESSGSCLSAPRPVRNVTVDSNLVINTWPNWRFGDIGIQVRGGAPDARSAAVNITITNNVMVSEPGVEAFIRIQTGTNSGTQTGTVTIVGNTFYGPVNRFSAIHIADPDQSSRQESFLIRNNIFAGGAVDRAITTEYAPNMWRTDFNVFPSNSRFGWNDGSGTDLAGWRNQSGGDGNSPSCDPLFVNINSADFHLTASDTCARDAGTPVGSVPAVDFEGDSRPPGGPWDIGADEFRS